MKVEPWRSKLRHKDLPLILAINVKASQALGLEGPTLADELNEAVDYGYTLVSSFVVHPGYVTSVLQLVDLEVTDPQTTNKEMVEDNDIQNRDQEDTGSEDRNQEGDDEA